jgi:hypothetical protein
VLKGPNGVYSSRELDIPYRSGKRNHQGQEIPYDQNEEMEYEDQGSQSNTFNEFFNTNLFLPQSLPSSPFRQFTFTMEDTLSLNFHEGPKETILDDPFLASLKSSIPDELKEVASTLTARDIELFQNKYRKLNEDLNTFAKWFVDILETIKKVFED